MELPGYYNWLNGRAASLIRSTNVRYFLLPPWAFRNIRASARRTGKLNKIFDVTAARRFAAAANRTYRASATKASHTGSGPADSLTNYPLANSATQDR